MRVPGLFHPGHARGVPALQGFVSLQDRSVSRRPRPSWRLSYGVRAQPLAPCIRVRALDHVVTDASWHRRPGACRAPSRTCRAMLAARGLSRRLLAEPLPRVPPAFVAARARSDGHRTASGSPSGPVSLQRAGVLGRGIGPVTRPVRPHGLHPLQGSLAPRRGTAFCDRPSPLGLPVPTAQRSGSLSRVVSWHMPLRVLPAWCLGVPPTEGRRPS